MVLHLCINSYSTTEFHNGSSIDKAQDPLVEGEGDNHTHCHMALSLTQPALALWTYAQSRGSIHLACFLCCVFPTSPAPAKINVWRVNSSTQRPTLVCASDSGHRALSSSASRSDLLSASWDAAFITVGVCWRCPQTQRGRMEAMLLAFLVMIKYLIRM